MVQTPDEAAIAPRTTELTKVQDAARQRLKEKSSGVRFAFLDGYSLTDPHDPAEGILLPRPSPKEKRANDWLDSEKEFADESHRLHGRARGLPLGG